MGPRMADLIVVILRLQIFVVALEAWRVDVCGLPLLLERIALGSGEADGCTGREAGCAANQHADGAADAAARGQAGQSGCAHAGPAPARRPRWNAPSDHTSRR